MSIRALRRIKVHLIRHTLALVVVVAVGDTCRDPQITTVCPAILYVRPTAPDSATLKVGANSVAIAGSAYAERFEIRWAREAPDPPT